MRGLHSKHSLDVSTPSFVAHLQQRLGVSQKEANDVLADWVRHYKPAKRRALNLLEEDTTVEATPPSSRGFTQHV